MRKASILAFVFVLAGLAAGANQETLEQLKSRAESVRPSDQVKLFMEIAQRKSIAATDFYEKGDAEAGKAAVEDVALYCERAGAAAQSSGKHLKHVEIHIRDLERKLEALQRSVSFDDREPLKTAVDRLEKTRSDLLSTMFRKK
jgi:hypothetical protein